MPANEELKYISTICKYLSNLDVGRKPYAIEAVGNLAADLKKIKDGYIPLSTVKYFNLIRSRMMSCTPENVVRACNVIDIERLINDPQQKKISKQTKRRQKKALKSIEYLY